MKIALNYYIYSPSWGEPSVVVTMSDMTRYPEYLLQKTIAIDIPDMKIPSEQELKSQMVASLNGQKAVIQAEAHMKLKELDEKIQSLLAIEEGARLCC